MVTLEKIYDAVERTTGLSPESLWNRDARRETSTARILTMMIMKDELGWGWRRIGNEMDRTHATVLINVNSMRHLVDSDKYVSHTYKRIMEKVVQVPCHNYRFVCQFKSVSING